MRKYKSHDGTYLDIYEHGTIIRIAWYLPEDGDFGAYTGESGTLDIRADNEEDKKALWEMATADAAVKPFSCGKDSHGFEFETMKQARLALIAANAALLNGGAPMPEWATKATAAGWKPPEGWKP